MGKRRRRCNGDIMRFTVVMVWYQGAVSDFEFTRMLKSLVTQDYKDFEVLIYHDGKLLKSITKEQQDLLNKLNYKLIAEGDRVNKWGHNNRHKGILKAKGEYIIHTNADNIFYNSLYSIDKVINKYNFSINIFPIKMNGLKITEINHIFKQISKTNNKHDYVILRGTPKFGKIDCMQLVMTKDLWTKIGGWYREDRDSDGYIYEDVCNKYDYKIFEDIIIGEHN